MTNSPRIKPRRQDLDPSEMLCEYCTAKCCRYFALPIETPETTEDFAFIRWYLFHGQASVFTEDGDWYLLVHTVCKHLQEDISRIYQKFHLLSLIRQQFKDV